MRRVVKLLIGKGLVNENIIPYYLLRGNNC